MCNLGDCKIQCYRNSIKKVFTVYFDINIIRIPFKAISCPADKR